MKVSVRVSDPNRDEGAIPGQKRSPDDGAESPTRPVESPLRAIRATLIQAVCDGDHQAYSGEALAEQRDASDRLRTLIRNYVAHLRDGGVPPERVLAFVKTVIRETEVPCGRPLLSLEQTILRWSIEAYYESTE